MAFPSVKYVLSSVALVASAWNTNLLADTTLTYQDQKNNGAQAFEIRVQPPYLRMDEAGGMWMLYDGQADVLYAVQPDEQSYSKMDRAMAKQLGGVLDAMQEQLKNLPPEQRAAVEEMMGRSMKKSHIKTEFVLSGDTRKLAGVECEVGYLVRSNRSRHEFCVAKPEALDMPKADYATMTKMFELMGALRDSAGGMFSQDMPDPSQIKGVTIESNGLKGGHQILKSYGHAKLDAGLFKIPTTYRQEVIPKLTP